MCLGTPTQSDLQREKIEHGASRTKIPSRKERHAWSPDPNVISSRELQTLERMLEHACRRWEAAGQRHAMRHRRGGRDGGAAVDEEDREEADQAVQQISPRLIHMPQVGMLMMTH